MSIARDIADDINVGNVGLPIKDSNNAEVLAEDINGVVTLTADEANVGSNALVVNSSGNVGIGTTTLVGSGTPDETNGGEGIRLLPFGFLGIGRNAGIIAQFNRSNDGDILGFRRGGASVGSIGVRAGDNLVIHSTTSGHWGLEFGSLGGIAPTDNTGAVVDNVVDLGNSNSRFNEIYLQNGAINGSDKNEKVEITNSDLGLNFIKRVNPVSYKWIGRYRTHYGMISQEIETLLSDVGKTSMDFAGFIKSPVTDEDGNETGEYRYGLRYTEFISPMIKAIQEQQTIIESQQSQIDALTAKTQEQDFTIASLISRVEALESNTTL